jgi:hypothetical protein
MNRIRVLIANHPRLMRELISATMADQPDIELVGEVGKQQDLAEATAETRPDVLIIPMDDEKEYRERGRFLLGRYPEMKIIALAGTEPGASLLGNHRHSERIYREFERWNSQRDASGTSSCRAGSNLGIIRCAI